MDKYRAEKPIEEETEAREAYVDTPILITEQEEEQEFYSPVAHGKPTDAMAVLIGRGMAGNIISGAVRVTFNGVTMDISEFNALAGTMGVSTHKLLTRGIEEFTKYNHFGAHDRSLRTLKVAIPLKEYASDCGYDITPHTMPTEAEQRKENSRAKHELDKVREDIKEDLDLLQHTVFSWSETIKNKSTDFLDVQIISGKGIVNGYIYMSFTQEFGEYLIQLPLTQMPKAFYRIDGRNPNAYNMCIKISEQYFNDNNQQAGTRNLLKVRTLLNVTNLKQSPEELGRNRSRWRARIKEPFELGLETLRSVGFLEDYYYSHSKGIRLTDEEAYNFKDFNTWADTLICFTLKDTPDQTARLEAREAEKEQREEKKRKSKAAKKKKAEKAQQKEAPPEENQT